MPHARNAPSTLLRLAMVLAPLVACVTPGAWVWRRDDGSYEEKQLRADIDECEAHTLANRDLDKAGRGALGARPYGEWGSFTFESCMHRKKWVLKREQPGDAPVPAATQAEAAKPAKEDAGKARPGEVDL